MTMTYEQEIRAQIRWHQDRIMNPDENGRFLSRKLTRKNKRAIDKLIALIK